MSKPEFGRKMTCTACAVRFYDLTRTPAVCPICGVEQPRAKPRAAPVARSPIRWSNRPVPPTVEAIVPEPTPIESDPLEEVEEEDEADDDDTVLADDEDETLRVPRDE